MKIVLVAFVLIIASLLFLGFVVIATLFFIDVLLMIIEDIQERLGT